MKNRIKLTESQLKKVISKIIREELINELEHSTMQNALLKTKHDKNRQGQHKRMAKNYGDRFFQQFEGRDLLGYRIRKIDINVGAFDPKFNQKDMSDVDFDKSFDIFVEIGGGEMITIKYDHKSDSINVDGDDIKTFQVSRKDAILLSKMISGYAVGSKYKVNNIHQNFLLRNNMQEAKLDRIIEQHIRKNLRNLK